MVRYVTYTSIKAGMECYREGTLTTECSHSPFQVFSSASLLSVPAGMKLIILFAITTMLTSSYVHDAQAASVSCTGRYYPKLYVFNSAYQSPGEYTLTGEYNDAPLYRHVSAGYSLYRRQNGFWYLDFNEVSEDYAGSISYSDDNDKKLPWLTGWKGDTVVLMTKAIFAHGIPYGATSDGKYETDGTMKNGFPVYNRNNRFFFYRRSDGKWYNTFEAHLPDSGGALNYGQNVALQPWESTYYPTATVWYLLECDV